MPHDVRIHIACSDRTGLLAVVTARLFDLGANLGDTSFAVLGERAELTSICEVPEDVTIEEVRDALRSLPELDGADVAVTAFTGGRRRPGGRATHRFEVRGTDRPGLVARLAEGFAEFGANIVRMDSAQLPGGAEGEYVVRFELAVPDDRAEACLSAAVNTAEAMGLAWRTTGATP